MILLRPIALGWLLIAVPVALLYWRRLRPRRLPVAAGHVWAQVFAAVPSGPFWRRWRRPMSLAIQAAVVGLLALAMAEPLLRQPRTLLVVIDNIPVGVDAESAAKLENAKRLASARLDGLGYRDRAAVLSTGDVLRVRCGLTESRGHWRQALHGLEVVPGRTDASTAVALARRLVLNPDEVPVAVFTADPSRFSRLPAAGLEVVAVGTQPPSAGLARLVPQPPAWSILAVVALAVLAAEWCTYQRRWTE